MAKRAVLYARVSGDDRSNQGGNLKSQLDMCRAYANERGWQIVQELAEDDRGASGADIDLPQLNCARDLAEDGQYDVLVVREVDRLSRNLAKQLIVEKDLENAGVKVEYVIGEYPDTPEGRLNKHIKATIAEYEREKINERMVRGRRRKVREGHVMLHGNRPYGYDVAEVDGKRSLVINKSEARVVKMIFSWYTTGQGASLMSIAARLTEMGIPTRGDKDDRIAKERGYAEWNRTSIRKILKRETYVGCWHYGKRGNDGPNPEDHQLTVDVPAIVSEATFAAAQERLKINKQNASRNTKYEYLMGRRLTCGCCGAKAHSRSTKPDDKRYFYYVCGASLGYGDYARECTQNKYFPAHKVDAVVWSWLWSLLSDSEMLAAGLKEEQARCREATKPLRRRLAVIDDLLAENRRKLSRLLELYLDGEFDKEILTGRKKELEKRVQGLEKERRDLQAKLASRELSDEQLSTIEAFAAKVRTGLEVAVHDFDTRRRAIELLQVSGTLIFEDGEMKIQAQCVMGETLLSIEDTNTPTGFFTIWRRSGATTRTPSC
jgi:site-specific DNA recombinase